MSGLDPYEHKLLNGWEEVFKRGQLTFWVLLALRDGPKHMAEIRTWMSDISGGTLVVEDRSLYRALQRFHDSELVESSSVPGNRGPDRKQYALSPVGERVLSAFIERNVRLFLSPAVARLITCRRSLADRPRL